jgi:hypothetical protein
MIRANRVARIGTPAPPVPVYEIAQRSFSQGVNFSA